MSYSSRAVEAGPKCKTCGELAQDCECPPQVLGRIMKDGKPTNRFLVQSQPYHDGSHVLNATGIPRLFGKLDGRIVRRKTATPIKDASGFQWQVEIETE